MTRQISEQDWKPIEIDDLEPVAWDVLKSSNNQSVIAGPGAGKTELLAQRASFLLQTGKCPKPKHILAISYKRDSASNLQERVLQRCGNEIASRFVSITFDSFAKNLMDRFTDGIPENWKIDEYEIKNPSNNEIDLFMSSIVDRNNRMGCLFDEEPKPSPGFFLREYVTGYDLPQESIKAKSLWQYAGIQWWKRCLNNTDHRRYISFPMIQRISELILRTNPRIRTALQLTYSHVFVDEFQDTTGPQYSLLRTAFGDSNTIITVVGDKKQQIMRWAGAMSNIFEKFEEDFGAKRNSLISNFRSSPELVKIQHTLARAIDKDYVDAESRIRSEFSTDHCIIYVFDNIREEAYHIAKYIHNAMTLRNLSPRSVALIVRQKPESYYMILSDAFDSYGMKLRDESKIQDLLSERLTKLVVSYLRLGSKDRSSIYWNNCLESTIQVFGNDLESTSQNVFSRLESLHGRIRKIMKTRLPSECDLKSLINIILDFLGKDNISSLYTEYSQMSRLRDVTTSLVSALEESCSNTNSWIEALDDFEGITSIPLLTIHKSKGHEYDTVIFIGLDDQAWWSFPSQPVESTSAFFVAFSRAKQMVVFTYCKARGSQDKIESLYSLLDKSGVKSVHI